MRCGGRARRPRRRRQHRAWRVWRRVQNRSDRPRHRWIGLCGRNRGAAAARRAASVGAVVALVRRTVRSPAGPGAVGTPLRRSRRRAFTVEAGRPLLHPVGHRFDRIAHDSRGIRPTRARCGRRSRARRWATGRLGPRIGAVRARRLGPRDGRTRSRDRSAHTQRNRERSDPTDEPASSHHVLLLDCRHTQVFSNAPTVFRDST